MLRNSKKHFLLMSLVVCSGTVARAQTSGNCPLTGTTVINFDDVLVPSGGEINATTYLNNHGITFSALTAGGFPVIFQPGAAIPTSPPNAFSMDVPGLGPGAASYELSFCSALNSITFTRTAIASVSGIPPWSATALNAQGQIVATFSEGFQIGPAARIITLTGSGITVLRIDGRNDVSRTTFNLPPLDDFTLAAGCQVNPNDVYTSLGPPNSLDGKPTTISAVFIPGASNGNPIGLASAAASCHFVDFDWVQLISELPAPSAVFAQSNSLEIPDATQPISIPPVKAPFHDPVQGGYTYQLSGFWQLYQPNYRNAYPFYYSPADLLSGCAVWDPSGAPCYTRIHEHGDTLNYFDSPKDPCIFGGKYAFQAQCGYTAALNPAFIKFTTQLVGICVSAAPPQCTAPGSPSTPLYEWSWESNFNGTPNGRGLGGISETASGVSPVGSTGTGGIIITSLNGVAQTPPTTTCEASPSTLWPPNGDSVTVRITGSIVPGTSALVTEQSAYQVIDSYGQLQPSGPINVDSAGNYSLSIALIASRRGGDQNGRTYAVNVVARDQIGNVGSCSVAVRVPHDQGN